MIDEHIPVPEHADTAAELVGEMRRLKSWSGLTFRQLEGRAAAAGDVLPRSTLVEALRRDRLPREELLAAFVRACGGGPDTVAEWLMIRRKLAVAGTGGPRKPSPASSATDSDIASGPTSDSESTSDSPPTSAPASLPLPTLRAARPQRWGGRPARVVVQLGVAITISAFMTAGSDVHGQGGKAPSALPGRQSVDARHQAPEAIPGRLSGRYKIRSAHSGLCLSEQMPESSGQIYQLPCNIAFPPLVLRAQADGTYLISPDHPVKGPGCMGIRNASTAPGEGVYNDFCGNQGANLGGDRFWVEPVTTLKSGFRISPVHSRLCLGFASGQARAGAPLLQQPCDGAALHQVFLLIRS